MCNVPVRDKVRNSVIRERYCAKGDEKGDAEDIKKNAGSIIL